MQRALAFERDKLMIAIIKNENDKGLPALAVTL